MKATPQALHPATAAVAVGKLELFDAKLMGVVALASVALSMRGTSLWMLITHFWEVIAFAKRLISGCP
jgi:hypothetical protein